MHALIIEDELLIALFIEEELRDMGYSCVIVENEADAVRAAERRWPDLITVEERLSQGSGIEAVRRICEQKMIATVYVLSVPDVHLDRLSPGTVVLGKPFRSTELHHAVAQAVRSLGSCPE
jgi:DNA-binding response OmpR family regulator